LVLSDLLILSSRLIVLRKAIIAIRIQYGHPSDSTGAGVSLLNPPLAVAVRGAAE
jgi:hypothetical protein